MPGAYVALPPEDTSPDLPPGWSLLWPFPGPYPPGYVPDLSMTLNTPPQMKPGVPVRNNSVTLFDQDSYATNEPEGTVTYTAVWLNPGETVELKFSGDQDFESSISESYGDVGDNFWGTTPDLEFDVDAQDIGKTIVLTATSVPFSGGITLWKSKNIEVVAEMLYTSTLTIVSSDPRFPMPILPYNFTWYWGVTAFVWDQDAGFGPYCEIFMNRDVTTPGHLPGYNANSTVNSNDPESQNGLLDFATEMPEDDGDPWYIGATPEGTMRMHFLRFLEAQLYDVSFEFSDFQHTTGSVTFTITLVISMDGEEQETVEKVVEIDSNQPPAGGGGIGETIWCTINGETGEITIINP